jgi:hypothetical protein
MKRRAAESTVEALLLGLREGGLRALDEPNVRRRQAELSVDQLDDVGARLLKPKIDAWCPWTQDEIRKLMQAPEALR